MLVDKKCVCECTMVAVSVEYGIMTISIEDKNVFGGTQCVHSHNHHHHDHLGGDGFIALSPGQCSQLSSKFN